MIPNTTLTMPTYVNITIRKMSVEEFNITVSNRASSKQLQVEVQTYFKKNYEQDIHIEQIQLIALPRTREKSLSNGDVFSLIINEREFYVYYLPLSEGQLPLQIKTRSSMTIRELSAVMTMRMLECDEDRPTPEEMESSVFKITIKQFIGAETHPTKDRPFQYWFINYFQDEGAFEPDKTVGDYELQDGAIIDHLFIYWRSRGYRRNSYLCT